MQRRKYLLTTAGALLTGLAGCQNNPAGTDQTTDDEQATGMLATAVSDDPQTAIGDFESLVVTIEEVWLHPKNAQNGEQGDDSNEHSELSVTTSDDGTASFDVPSDIDKIDVDVTHGENEGEIEYEFDGDGTETDDDTALDVAFVGEVARGAEATIEVTENGDPVADATAEVTFETDADTANSDTNKSAETDTDAEVEDGKIVIDVDDAQVDLVELQGDAQSVIDETELEVGEFTGLKLHVSNDVEATLTDGSEADVMKPGEAPLKFNKEFEIRENTKTTFTADFAPHTRGPPGSERYVLRPVATEVRVNYSDLSTSAGNQTATDSDTNGTETNTSD